MAPCPAVEQFGYHKRGLTENIIVKVASNDAALPTNDPEGFLDLVKDFSNSETLGQQNMCPVVVNPEVVALSSAISAAFPGLRFRKVQLAKVLSVGAVENVSEEYAETLLKTGSIAFIATSFDDQSVMTLLKYGILPLVSTEPIPVGTCLIIKGVVNDIWLNCKELAAFESAGVLKPFALRLPNLYVGQEPTYNLDHLNPLLKG